MQTFYEWAEKTHNEDWRNWVAGAAAGLGGLAGMNAPQQAWGQEKPAMVQQQAQEVSLGKDLRKPTATISGDKIIIKYLPALVFGGTWKTGKNSEVNEQLLTKYRAFAEQQLGVKIGEKLEVKEDGKFLVWTLKLVK
jgi:hypothetical protein